ncbi:MAG TPA: class I SAM-dependent methyltransferase, partial [Silvibacterium sp.]|nr:class I SAM-dependent methyltransferase [Silvibacterium sp.]
MISATNSYDAVPYPGFAYPNMHPDSLAAMAILHGLFPAPVEHCRVLEVACGDGANLIPMAYAIPGSEFIGFDMAGQPIERGQARIRQLGLTNIRLFQGNVLEVGKELGMFDYLIAHGLYSW